MTVQLSLVLVLGTAAAGLVRSGQLKPAPGLMAALFGFLLNDTPLAPSIRQVVAAVLGVINQFHL
ncbi:hypothetical protein [Streptomyces meridianus]|uniref:Uncharacterized protein n=1 Tax=Streptomyces meridianus TaxID=2938945 RepID=A0ABT0X3V9_9ACTN|nr:hypothetical protein [Streptomyces meridianus]MCM2576347.1 hypothetical protein [Streptomyces meridianus]